MKRLRLASQRGMTLIEIMVAVAVLAGIAVLINGVMVSLSNGKKGEALRAERIHQGREAVQRIVRDLSAAYLSMHVNAVPALMTEKTAFVGRPGTPFDRVDFAAFAHLRTERNSHESDQAEVALFRAARPGRRRQDGPRPARADAHRHRPPFAGAPSTWSART